jgi:hypothetical protein
MLIEHLMLSLSYLTNLSLILVLIAPYIYKYIDLLFLSLFVCVGGLYVSYLNPGIVVIEVQDNVYEINGVFKIIFDVILHVLPLLYILTRYGEYYKSNPNIIPSLIIILVYISCFDIASLYKTNTNVIGLIFILCIIFYSFYTKMI